MNQRELNLRDALLRVKQFATDNPMNPANARATALVASISGALTEIDTQGGNQDSGRGLARGGVGECRRIATELRSFMNLIAGIGKAVDAESYPGLAESLRMPGNSYAELEIRAQNFVEVVALQKPVFVDRMMPVDFDETLQGLVAAFVAARSRKHSGRLTQVGGTAGITAAVQRGMRQARELDAMMRVLYASNPAMLATWKSAVRVKRSPQGTGGSSDSAQTPPATPEPTVPPAPSAPAAP